MIRRLLLVALLAFLLFAGLVGAAAFLVLIVTGAWLRFGIPADYVLVPAAIAVCIIAAWFIAGDMANEEPKL